MSKKQINPTFDAVELAALRRLAEHHDTHALATNSMGVLAPPKCPTCGKLACFAEAKLTGTITECWTYLDRKDPRRCRWQQDGRTRAEDEGRVIVSVEFVCFPESVHGEQHVWLVDYPLDVYRAMTGKEP